MVVFYKGDGHKFNENLKAFFVILSILATKVLFVVFIRLVFMIGEKGVCLDMLLLYVKKIGFRVLSNKNFLFGEKQN